MKKVTAFVLAATASVSLSANAGIVTNDTELLSAAGHQQFIQWLGEDVDLTRIFAKQEGDTSQDWHAAVDNQGPTLSLIEIFNGSDRMVIGGYTALNWAGSGYGTSYDGYENFLMNLSKNNVYRKRTDNNTAIYKHESAGPIFGGGRDFYVNGSLTGGFANLGHSYGDYSRYGDADYQQEFTGTYDSWTVGNLETFTLSSSTGDFGTGATANIDEQGNTFSATNVSAPAGLAALGLMGLIGLGRRRRLKTIDEDFI